MTVASSPKTHGEHPQNAEFAMTLEQAAAMIERAVKDKTYQQTPLGEDVAAYLRAAKKGLAPASLNAYEGTLHKLVVRYPNKRVEDFDTATLEDFLDTRWGDVTPAAYNVCLAHVRSFFKHWERLDRIDRNPAVRIDPAKRRDVDRSVFSGEERAAILAAGVEQRDRVALRLLLDYGIRKGALRSIRFRDFDWQRRELKIYTKGQKIRSFPLPDPVLWTEIERLIQDTGASGHHWLMYLVKEIPRAGRRRFLGCQLSSAATHAWWYRHLARAGVVPEGTTSGAKIHKARHSAGQRVLDETGDLKLAQRFLGHSSIRTTADIYVDYDNAQVAEKTAVFLARSEGS